MKKTAKASFIIGIILLTFSVLCIIFSFSAHGGQQQVVRGYNYFYSLQINSSSALNLRALQSLILGSALMISGLLLFVLTAVLNLKATKLVKIEKKDEPKTQEKNKKEIKQEVKPTNTEHYQNNIDEDKTSEN